MKKRQPEENTFGWRLMRAREDRQMSQKDVIDRLAKYLEMDDIRTANAWLRERFAVTIETRRVTNIELLF